MTTFYGRTYWLIGASEGLGRELALQLDEAGAQLVLSARSIERLQSLSARLPMARILPLDVTDEAAVQRACTGLGQIDGVIYNAGAYDPMPTQQWDAQAVQRMVDVNLLGALRVLGQMMPHFLARGQGDITLIGSLAGYRGLPKAIGYGASKSALISLAETMRHDLAGTGITVRLVNPGFIRTRLTQKNQFRMPMLMSATDAAARVLRAMQSRRFRTDFPAPFSWAIRLYAMLPDVLIYRGR